MTDKELKEIRQKISCPQLGDEHYGEWGALRKDQRFTIKRMLDHIDAQEEYIRSLHIPEWISVKDRLPKKDGTYLCCHFFYGSYYTSVRSFAKNLRKVDKYDFDTNKSGWYDSDSEWGYYEVSNVTHWMPLPELPKE